MIAVALIDYDLAGEYKHVATAWPCVVIVTQEKSEHDAACICRAIEVSRAVKRAVVLRLTDHIDYIVDRCDTLEKVVARIRAHAEKINVFEDV